MNLIKDFARIMRIEWNSIGDEDASLLIIELNDKKHIQQYLNLCRELRIPYLFIRPQQAFRIDKISLPITFLVEDKEKIPFASAFGRFCNSNIMIYKFLVLTGIQASMKVGFDYSGPGDAVTPDGLVDNFFYSTRKTPLGSGGYDFLFVKDREQGKFGSVRGNFVFHQNPSSHYPSTP